MINQKIILNNIKLIKNPLINIFEKKIIDKKNLSLYFKGTRDVKDINVLIDKETGGLILDKSIDDLEKYYSENEIYSKEENITLIDESLVESPSPLDEDDMRRYELYKEELLDSSVLDFGCGKGGFLKNLKYNNISKDLYGLELNQVNNRNINSNGIKCVSHTHELKTKFDYIFLNHVFEHLTDPINVLKNLIKLLKKDGKIIIEIPHGDDFLIKKSKLQSFKKFTFWSEHVCLYTEKLFSKLLKEINIKEYHFSFFQRYNLNNHIHWFKNGKPGGHISNKIYDASLLNQYEKYLVSKKETDTLLIVIGNKCKEFSAKVFNQ